VEREQYDCREAQEAGCIELRMHAAVHPHQHVKHEREAHRAAARKRECVRKSGEAKRDRQILVRVAAQLIPDVEPHQMQEPERTDQRAQTRADPAREPAGRQA
jgi:hypothetical protein